MAKKQTVTFESFNDGLVSFWQLTDRNCPVPVAENIRYQDRVVGIKRNYCAEQAGHTVTKLIRIPRTDLTLQGCFAVIGEKQYQVLQAQVIRDTAPRCADITLEQPDLLLNFDPSQAGPGGRL